MNFGEMSDEELRQFILSPSLEAAQRREAKPPEKPSPLIEGKGTGELFQLGLKKSLADPFVHGPHELVKSIWSGPQSEMDQLNQEKAARQALEQEVMKTTPGKLGFFAGKAGISAIAPARLGAQVGTAALGGFMSPTEGPVRGPGGQIASRGMQALEAGGTTAAVGIPLSALGRSLGAATGRYSPEGARAIELSEAGKRLGVDRGISDLDPASSISGFERSLPSHPRSLEKQIGQFTRAAQEEVKIPSKSGKSTETRTLEGEKLRKSIEEAGKNLQGVGNSLWNELDSYVVQNNLPGVKAKLAQTRLMDIDRAYTPKIKGQVRIDRNPILQRVEEYDPESAIALAQMLTDPKKVPQLPFSDLHKIQSAVGKAMARAERDASAPGASLMDRKSRIELRNLYGSLMTDVDSWGVKNPTAQEMFNEARGFWRDVVVPGVITSKPYGKASKGVYGMNPRGYSEPSQLYSDVVKNPRAMQDLYPYMDQTGRDLVDTLSSHPELAKSLIANTKSPAASGMGTQTVAAGAIIGSPLQMSKAMVSQAPGIHWFMNSPVGKQLYFSRNVFNDTPLGRASWGMLQEPQQQAEDYLNEMRMGNRP